MIKLFLVCIIADSRWNTLQIKYMCVSHSEVRSTIKKTRLVMPYWPEEKSLQKYSGWWASTIFPPHNTILFCAHHKHEELQPKIELQRAQIEVDDIEEDNQAQCGI